MSNVKKRTIALEDLPSYVADSLVVDHEGISVTSGNEVVAVIEPTRKSTAATVETRSGGQEEDPLLKKLDEWAADESGYDEETWPVIKERLEEHRRITGQRPLFSDNEKTTS